MLRPLGLALRAKNQILPELDQRMSKPSCRAVPVERVAPELAVIGHIFADGERDAARIAKCEAVHSESGQLIYFIVAVL